MFSPNSHIHIYMLEILTVSTVHSLWGYSSDDINGDALVHWEDLTNLVLLFDAKEKGSFLARWKKDYNPDLYFISQEDGDPLPVERIVLEDFPNSQQSTNRHQCWNQSPSREHKLCAKGIQRCENYLPYKLHLFNTIHSSRS